MAQSERLRRSNRHHSPIFALGFFIYLVLVVGFPTYCFGIDPFCSIVPAHAAGARTFSCARESTQRVRPRGIHPLGEPLKVAAAGLLGVAWRNDGSE